MHETCGQDNSATSDRTKSKQSENVWVANILQQGIS